MSTTPLVFTGISKYSNDLQTVLQRAVSIASLPLQTIQNQQTDVLGRKQQLGDIASVLQTLGTSVTQLGSVGDKQAVTASSSNTVRVAVTTSGTPQTGVHTISDITSVARAASETSATGYATADSTAVATGASLELAFGSHTYSVPLAAGQNNLSGIRDAINGLGVGVSATVVNTGSGPTPYYLSISSNSPGATTLQLRQTAGNPATNILTSANQGANAVFKLDGLQMSRADNVISDAIQGLSFTIVSQTSQNEQVTVTLASDRGALANALNSLVTNYNAVVDKLSGQVGENAGLLQGDFIVRQIQSTLRSLTGFSGSGAVQSLADLGISLDKTGKMSFDDSAVYSLSTAGLASAFNFLDSSGGLGGLASQFNSLTDPISGLIQVQQKQYDATDTRLTSEAATLQEHISNMQASLSQQLQAADALLATLDNQQSILTGSIDALNYAAYGKITQQ